jgi:hypothetical protein
MPSVEGKPFSSILAFGSQLVHITTKQLINTHQLYVSLQYMNLLVFLNRIVVKVELS